MTNEEKILATLTEMTEAMNKGFSDMSARFVAIEDRLGKQEKKSRKTAMRQTLQENEIRQLKEAVQQLASSEGCWSRGNLTAVRKEAVYQKIEETGIGKVAAMRALRNSGVLKQDPEGKNTCTIYLDGECKRVVVVYTDK